MHQYPPPDKLDNRIRTPSPTPSETKELNSGLFDWKTLSNWRFWIRKEWIWYYLALVIAVVLVVLMFVFHDDIMHWLRPAADWLYELPAGWLVPIAVLFVLSFPPLFGHEIVGVLCGLVWGLGVGFAIISAGTLLGEIGNYYAFKWCCRARGEKLERTKLQYACLAKAVRDGGIWVALVARLSAIPGHFTTAVFSTCGIGIIPFTIAAILSLPKQFITVYLGVIIEDAADGQRTTKDKIISYVVVGVTLFITIWAMWYIYHKMNLVKPEIIYARRKARQEKMMRAAAEGPYTYSTNSDVEAAEVELRAPRPLSYDHFSTRIGALEGNQAEHAGVDENGVRTKVRYGRGSPSMVSESEPFVHQSRHDILHSPPDDQPPLSPFADPPPRGNGHDREETFYTAREHSPPVRKRSS